MDENNKQDIRFIDSRYTRLSRDDGDKSESDSISSQKDMIREYLRDRADMVIVQEYVDDGYSGVNFDRPGFQKMMEDIKAKKVNCIVCKDLSRFARNYIDSGRYIEKIFPFMGVRFIAINDNYDSNGERSQSDSLIVPFKNLINDAYCKDISMKIRSQLDIKRKMGDFIGAFAAFGYRKSPENKNKLVVDEPAAQIVELIFRLRLQGMSNSRIADKLNEMGVLSPMEYKRSNGMRYESGFRTNERALWNAVSVLRILTNELYIGTLTQHKRGTPNYKVKKEIRYEQEDWIVIQNNHEPIVDICIWLIHMLITAGQEQIPTDRNFSVCWQIFMPVRFVHWLSRIFPVSPVIISKLETCWRMYFHFWGYDSSRWQIAMTALKQMAPQRAC